MFILITSLMSVIYAIINYFKILPRLAGSPQRHLWGFCHICPTKDVLRVSGASELFLDVLGLQRNVMELHHPHHEG